MIPPGRPGTTAARSASACGPRSGLMRTQSRDRSDERAASNAQISWRAPGFSPSATASSRSRMTMSAGPLTAFSIFRSLSPGAKSHERAWKPSAAPVMLRILRSACLHWTSLCSPQRQPEQCSPPQPKARAVAIRARDLLHLPQHFVHARRAEPLAPLERPAGIVLRKPHGDIDIGWGADADLRELAGEIHDHGQDSGSHESGGVLDYGHGETRAAQVCGELLHAAVTPNGAHQRQKLPLRAQEIHGHDPRRIEPEPRGGGRRILTVRTDESELGFARRDRFDAALRQQGEPWALLDDPCRRRWTIGSGHAAGGRRIDIAVADCSRDGVALRVGVEPPPGLSAEPARRVERLVQD